MTAFSTNLKIGILGGGQLGRMLLQSAVNLNLDVAVLDPDAAAPCRDLCARFVCGSFQDFQTVYDFGKTVDLLTIEIENVNVAALKRLRDEGLAIFPQPEVIEVIQDKGAQKAFLKKHGLPTADFVLVQNRDELAKHGDFLPAVQKLRVAGYDGRGVFKITDAKDFANAFNAPSVVEKFIPFVTEIAVIAARSPSGEVKTFPAVEMAFHPTAHLVEFLFSPAKISPRVESKARDLALKAVQVLGCVGLLAVEMFVTDHDEVLINEMAPRPHNSGHHTIEANVVSQFEAHWRAILDLPIGDTSARVAAVMVNVLGAEGHTGPARYEGLDKILAMDGVAVHLYGKKLTKPLRKMGHVTVTDADLETAMAKAKTVKNTLKVVT